MKTRIAILLICVVGFALLQKNAAKKPAETQMTNATTNVVSPVIIEGTNTYAEFTVKPSFSL